MFEEPNKKTLNMRFIRIGDYEFKTEKISKRELLELRKKAKPENFMAIGRSCWECNSAHVHHLDSKGEYNCFVCGRYYMDGVDITNYSGTSLEKYAKSNLKNN